MEEGGFHGGLRDGRTGGSGLQHLSDTRASRPASHTIAHVALAVHSWDLGLLRADSAEAMLALQGPKEPTGAVGTARHSPCHRCPPPKQGHQPASPAPATPMPQRAAPSPWLPPSPPCQPHHPSVQPPPRTQVSRQWAQATPLLAAEIHVVLL